MEKQLYPIKRPPLLHYTVQEAIRTYIIENNLQPGDMLPPENNLAQQLDVSRSSVREAIKGLESLGVLEARRGSGVFVRSFSFEPILNNLQYGLLSDLQELVELLEIRCILETAMVGQALAIMGEEQLVEMEEILEQMRRRAEAGEAFPEEDRAFHRLLFREVKNQTMLKLLDIFWLAFNKVIQHTPALWDDNPYWTYQLHAAIVVALRDGDAAEASKALKAHHAGVELRLERATISRVGLDVDSAEPLP
jgi:DNA-binding FadR family transcriptional regulator